MGDVVTKDEIQKKLEKQYPQCKVMTRSILMWHGMILGTNGFIVNILYPKEPKDSSYWHELSFLVDLNKLKMEELDEMLMKDFEPSLKKIIENDPNKVVTL